VRRDLGNEVIVAIIAVGVIAFAVIFGIVLSLSNANPTAAPTAPAQQPTLRFTLVIDAQNTQTAALLAESAAQPTATPSPTSTPRPTDTDLPTETRTLTNTPRPTLTDTPTETRTLTNTPRPTFTDTQTTLTHTPRPSATASPRPTDTPRPTFTDTAIPSPTNTETATPSRTFTVTLTHTPRPTLTHTPRPTFTDTPTPSSTPLPPTDTPHPTRTPRPSPTDTAAACPAPVGWVTYVLSPTDTLYALAVAASSSVDQLREANCLNDGDLPPAGAAVALPRLPAQPIPVFPPVAPERDLNREGCTFPGAIIGAPLPGEIVSGVIDVIGTASMSNFAYYRVEVRPDAAPTFDLYERGETPVIGGTLAELNTDLYGDGLHWLRLTVVQPNGEFPTRCVVPVIFR
jgi:hypothetical protein